MYKSYFSIFRYHYVLWPLWNIFQWIFPLKNIWASFDLPHRWVNYWSELLFSCKIEFFFALHVSFILLLMQRYNIGCGVFWLQCPKRMQTRRRVATGWQNRWRAKFQGTVDATEYTNLLEQSLFKVWLENTLPLSCVVHSFYSFYCENQSIKIIEHEFQGKYIIKFFPIKIDLMIY